MKKIFEIIKDKCFSLFNNMKITKKVFLMNIIAIIFTVLVGITGYIYLNIMSHVADEVYKQNLMAVYYSVNACNHIQSSERY